MKIRSAQGGFTLLEIVMAMAIAAAVALMGTSALSTASSYQQRSLTQAQHKAALHSAEHFLTHLLTQQRKLLRATSRELVLLMPPSSQHGGEEGSAPVLRLPVQASLQCRPVANDRFDLLYWIEPMVRRDVTTGRFMPEKSTMTDIPADAEVLLPGLAWCAFEYGLQPSEKEGGQWLSEWQALNRPPSLLRIHLENKLGQHPRLVFALAEPHV